MITLVCHLVIIGMMVCQPGDRMVETYVAGDYPGSAFTTASVLRDASSGHRAIWGNLTNEEIDAAFADWGPRRHIPIDWTKVRGVKAP